MRVDKFPHDEHEITLKLAILANRRSNQRWDSRKWKLGLATEQDSQGSTRIPYGILIGSANIPDFIHVTRELTFQIFPLCFAIKDVLHSSNEYVHVSLPVQRDSGHYDKNIMP